MPMNEFQPRNTPVGMAVNTVRLNPIAQRGTALFKIIHQVQPEKPYALTLVTMVISSNDADSDHLQPRAGPEAVSSRAGFSLQGGCLNLNQSHDGHRFNMYYPQGAISQLLQACQSSPWLQKITKLSAWRKCSLSVLPSLQTIFT